MSQSKEARAQEIQTQKWISLAALSSAILAVLAALSGMSSNFHGNAITRELIRNSNEWNYYQAKGIKANLLQTKIELLASTRHEASEQDKEKLKEYKLEQEKISERAKEHEEKIEHHLKIGGLFTKGVTFFQIAIGMVAVSILTRRNWFWIAGLGLASVGIVFAVQGFLISS